MSCSLQNKELLSALIVLSISASDSVLTQYGFLGTRNKSVTKTLILRIAETPHVLLILVVASHESSALALVPERQPAELRCCPRALAEPCQQQGWQRRGSLVPPPAPCHEQSDTSSLGSVVDLKLQTWTSGCHSARGSSERTRIKKLFLCHFTLETFLTVRM